MSENTGGYTGLDAFEYLNLGTYAAKAWSRLKRVEDVDMPDERTSVELKLKGTEFEKTLVGQRKTSVSFVYKLKRGTDPIYAALKTAYETKGCVEYLAADGDITVSGSAGTAGPYMVTKFGEKRPFGDAVGVEVELKLADAEIPGSPGTDWELEAIVTP